MSRNKQRDRLKEHRKIIKYIRLRNKQMAADDYIGLNRFRIDLDSEQWWRYEDLSGVHMTLILKMTDKVTGNTAHFVVDNYNYIYKIFEYLNDFLIRCSSGRSGHWPHLGYAAYDVHEVVPYDGDIRNGRKLGNFEEGVIDTYSWL